MAPLLFRDKKGVNFSCASPASTAICTSIDHRSMVRPSTGRAIDHHNPHLRDPRRAKALANPMSQTPSRPKSYSQKSRKSSDHKQVELISPAGSSRYLLNDAAFFDALPDLEYSAPPRVSTEPAKLRTLLNETKLQTVDLRETSLQSYKRDEVEVPAADLNPSSSTKQDQVVVLRVSIHCKGCEGKVRKHISKMEGVTSFNIDFATKKVTVVGDVTPLGVLNSISKVKNAQFWPSPPRS